MRLATQHLLKSGHHEIACIVGPPGWSVSQEQAGLGTESLARRREPCLKVLVRLINQEPVGSPLHLLRASSRLRRRAVLI